MRAPQDLQVPSSAWNYPCPSTMPTTPQMARSGHRTRMLKRRLFLHAVKQADATCRITRTPTSGIVDREQPGGGV